MKTSTVKKKKRRRSVSPRGLLKKAAPARTIFSHLRRVFCVPHPAGDHQSGAPSALHQQAQGSAGDWGRGRQYRHGDGRCGPIQLCALGGLCSLSLGVGEGGMRGDVRSERRAMWSPSLSVKDSRRVGWRDAGSARVGTRSRQRESERDRCGEGEAYRGLAPRACPCFSSLPSNHATAHACALTPLARTRTPFNHPRERETKRQRPVLAVVFSGQGVVVLI